MISGIIFTNRLKGLNAPSGCFCHASEPQSCHGNNMIPITFAKFNNFTHNALMTDEYHCMTLKSQRTICKSQTVAQLKKCPVVLVHVHLVVSCCLALYRFLY